MKSRGLPLKNHLSSHLQQYQMPNMTVMSIKQFCIGVEMPVKYNSVICRISKVKS